MDKDAVGYVVIIIGITVFMVAMEIFCNKVFY